jgi:hypothetical protein
MPVLTSDTVPTGPRSACHVCPSGSGGLTEAFQDQIAGARAKLQWQEQAMNRQDAQLARSAEEVERLGRQLDEAEDRLQSMIQPGSVVDPTIILNQTIVGQRAKIKNLKATIGALELKLSKSKGNAPRAQKKTKGGNQGGGQGGGQGQGQGRSQDGREKRSEHGLEVRRPMQTDEPHALEPAYELEPGEIKPELDIQTNARYHRPSTNGLNNGRDLDRSKYHASPTLLRSWFDEMPDEIDQEDMLNSGAESGNLIASRTRSAPIQISLGPLLRNGQGGWRWSGQREDASYSSTGRNWNDQPYLH